MLVSSTCFYQASRLRDDAGTVPHILHRHALVLGFASFRRSSTCAILERQGRRTFRTICCGCVLSSPALTLTLDRVAMPTTARAVVEIKSRSSIGDADDVIRHGGHNRAAGEAIATLGLTRENHGAEPRHMLATVASLLHAASIRIHVPHLTSDMHRTRLVLRAAEDGAW